MNYLEKISERPITAYKSEWAVSVGKQPPDGFESKSLALRVSSNLNPRLNLLGSKRRCQSCNNPQSELRKAQRRGEVVVCDDREAHAVWGYR